MGARSRYGDDEQLTRATRLAVLRVGFAAVLTAVAIAMSYALLVGMKGLMGLRAAWMWGHWWGVGALALLVVVLSVGAFRRVRVASRRVRGAELLPDDSRFVAMLARLCALADMPRPRLALVDLPMRNAFVGEAPGQPVTIYLSRNAAYDLPDAAVALGFVPPRERGFGYPEDTHPTLAKRTEVLARVATTLGSRLDG